MTTPALADLGGLWRRAWIAAPGLRDETTAVFWRQDAATGLYVDLRIPADLPDLSGARALAELDGPALLALARCEGFAGSAAVEDGVCAWTRAINWRGPETGADLGRLRFTPEGLHEAGVLAPYEELWIRDETAAPSSRMLVDGEGRVAVVAWTATRFSLGWGDPATLRGPPLADRLAAGLRQGDRAALAAALDAEFSLGVIEGGRARITLSTNPLRAGAQPFAVADLDAPDLVIEDRGFGGEPRARRWRAAAPSRPQPAPRLRSPAA